MGNLAEALPTCNCTDPDCALAHGATVEELDRYYTTNPSGWLLAHAAELAPFALDADEAEPMGDHDDLDALLDGAADVLPTFVLDADASYGEDSPEAWTAWSRWSFSTAAFNAHHDASTADVRHTEFLIDEGVLHTDEVCRLPRG
jgi:hypothetical protein